MTMRRLSFAALAAATLVAGCSGTQNRGLESVHQPIVSRTEYAFDVAAGPNGLSPSERGRLAGWMDGLRLGYGDRVAIDDPSYAASRTARADVARELARRGMLLSDDVPVTSSPVQPGTIRVVVTRMQASVPGCPDHSRMQGIDYEANTSSNHGCALNSNVAAMVANSGDLVRGQPGSGSYDPRVGTRAIGAFRDAAPTGGGGTTVKSEGSGGK